jgi:hypothetical protein
MFQHLVSLIFFLKYFDHKLIYLLDIHSFRKIRKIALIFKYQSANARILQNQIQLLNIEQPHVLKIDKYIYVKF